MAFSDNCGTRPSITEKKENAEQLANEYAPKDTSKVVALKKLDKKAKLPANIFAYSFGIITALVTGVGMCLSMNVIGNGSLTMFVLGVVIGIIGLLGMGINYTIYKKLITGSKKNMHLKSWRLQRRLPVKNKGGGLIMKIIKTQQIAADLIKQAKNNYQFITSVSSSVSAVINIAYMIFNGVMGIVYLSLWNGSICVYYLLLGLIRLLRILSGRKRFSDCTEKRIFQRKVYIRTHLLLLLMDAAMITPVMVMANGERNFTYGLIPAIAYASYVTYKIATAVRHFAKTRKNGNILISELRLINLTDALLAY